MRRNRIIVFAVVLSLILAVAILVIVQIDRGSFSQQRIGTSNSSGAVFSSQHENLFSVVKVVDGDTIDVLVDGKSERVRFIGIDTPETVDDRKKVQCYGPEASERMKELLSGKSVALETKPDEDKDDYGRLLRYVILDGSDIGAEMIEEGYAKSLCFAFPHPRCEEYDKLEREARELKRGRWGTCR